MALGLASLGRLAVIVLLLIQCGCLTAFPVYYKKDSRLISVVLLYVPALFYWIHCLRTTAGLFRVFCTWGLYVVIALIPHISVTFALSGDKLDSEEKFLNPNWLKVFLCITPVLFLVLVNAATDLGDHEDYRQLALTLSVQITIDLFDGVEMLDIVLDEKENSHGIPKEFGIAMIAVACLSFLMSLLQIAENKLNDGSVTVRKRTAIAGNVLQIALVNLPFMIMRIIVFAKYKKDESIFIAKNIIAIFISSLQIYWIKTTTD